MATARAKPMRVLFAGDAAGRAGGSSSAAAPWKWQTEAIRVVALIAITGLALSVYTSMSGIGGRAAFLEPVSVGSVGNATLRGAELSSVLTHPPQTIAVATEPPLFSQSISLAVSTSRPAPLPSPSESSPAAASATSASSPSTALPPSEPPPSPSVTSRSSSSGTASLPPSASAAAAPPSASSSGSSNGIDTASLVAQVEARRLKTYAKCGEKFAARMRTYIDAHTPAQEAALVAAWKADPAANSGVRAISWRCREVEGTGVRGSADDLCGGIGDRFIGMMSMFAIALLSNSAFYVDWPLSPYAFKPALAGFDWKLNGSAYASLPAVGGVKDEDRINADSPFNYYAPDTLRGNIKEPLLSVRTNRGSISILWSGRLIGAGTWRPIIENEWGLSASSTFGCLLGSIIRPADATLVRFSRIVEMQLSGEHVFIGVHVRMGDSDMKKGARAPSADTYMSYFDAATQVESSVLAAHPGKSVKWLLVSDNPGVRAAGAALGDKVIVPDVNPVHVSKRDVEKIFGAGVTEAMTGVGPGIALQEGFGEWWLLSQCDYFVINMRSAFGRTAAAFSLGGSVVKLPGSSGLATVQDYWDHFSETRRRRRRRR